MKADKTLIYFHHQCIVLSMLHQRICVEHTLPSDVLCVSSSQGRHKVALCLQKTEKGRHFLWLLFSKVTFIERRFFIFLF